MTKSLSAFVIGIVFGIGLLVSGLANPAKVLAFLDIAGSWDPSLAFVMAGAVAIAAIAFRVAAIRKKALLGGDIELPSNKTIDKPLAIGSLIFGIGWGIAGVCPGPGFVLVGSGETGGLIFIVTLFIGLFAAQRIKPLLNR